LPNGFEGIFTIEGQTRDTDIDRGSSIAGVVFDTSATPSSVFDIWLSGYNLTDESPDMDHDGIEFLLEYVLNGDPTLDDTVILPTIQKGEDGLTFQFTRRASSTADTNQFFQYSYDLITWEDDLPLTGDVIPAEVTLGVEKNGVQEVTISLTSDESTGRRMFGRLKVERK